jgi:Haem-binding domain
MKIIKKILLLLFIGLLISQFFSPEKNEGNLASVNAFFEDTNPPEAVKLILKESCFDCHSSFTRYPWYNSITPVNYWIAGHIEEAQEELNFSKWKDYSIKKKDHKLDELIEVVEKKEMPLPSYTWTHGKAKLSKAQIEAVVEWANFARIKYGLAPKPE